MLTITRYHDRDSVYKMLEEHIDSRKLILVEPDARQIGKSSALWLLANTKNRRIISRNAMDAKLNNENLAHYTNDPLYLDGRGNEEYFRSQNIFNGVLIEMGVPFKTIDIISKMGVPFVGFFSAEYFLAAIIRRAT